MSLFGYFFLHCVTVPGLSLAGLTCMIKWGSGRDGVCSGVGPRRDPDLIAHSRAMFLLNQSRTLSVYLLAFFLLTAPDTHKTCILIAGEICQEFLTRPALSNTALIEAFKNSSVRYLEKNQQINCLSKTAEMVTASVSSKVKHPPWIISLSAWIRLEHSFHKAQ